MARGTAPQRQSDPFIRDADVTPSDDDDIVDDTGQPFGTTRGLTTGTAGDIRLHLWGNLTNNASGTLALSSASGSVGGAINGASAITVTASGGDVATATALAAAINASVDVLVAGIVTASNVVGGTATANVVVTYKNYSPAGDLITLVASGSGVTASGATLSGSYGSRLYKNQNNGQTLPANVTRVLATGTTAGSIVAGR